MWLGELSYSLYLFHEPVRWVCYAAVQTYLSLGPFGHDMAAFATLGLALVLARCMYVVVERPSQQWSSRLRYALARAPTLGQGRRAANPTPQVPLPAVGG